MTEETNLQAETPAETALPVDAAPVTAPEAPERATDDPGTPEQPEDKPRGGFQRRIGELTRNWREAERRNEELMALLQRVAPPQKPSEPTTPPTLEQSGFDEQKYQQAVIEYAKAEARREAQEALRQEREQAQRATRVESFKTREESFADTVEDYHDVVYSEATPISPAMAEVIQESEVGPQLAYHLAKNPTLARALYSLPPVQAARELGKLEVKLSAPKPVVTKAPPPPPKIEATEPAVEKSPAEMTDAEFAKWRKRQIAQRR